jgi:hypothetical protein
MSKNKWALLITTIAIVIGFGSIYFLGKYNPIEQEAEKIVEAETGMVVDLSK